MTANASDTSSAGLMLGTDNAWMVNGQFPYIFENPAVLGKFKNTAYFESGLTTADNATGCIVLGLGAVTLAMPMGRAADVYGTTWLQTPSTVPLSLYNTTSATSAIPAVARTQTAYGAAATAFDLKAQTYAGASVAKINKNDFGFITSFDAGPLAIGVIFAWASATNNHENEISLAASLPVSREERVHFNNNQMIFKLGAEYKVSDSTSIGVDAAYVKYGINNHYTSTDTTAPTDSAWDYKYATDGAGDINIGANIAIGLSEKKTLHINIHDTIINHSTKYTAEESAAGVVTLSGEDTYSRKGNKLTVGFSDETRVTKDIVLYVGFMLSTISLTTKYDSHNTLAGVANPNLANPIDKKYNSLEIPAYLGVEAKLSENWTGRFGARQYFYQKPLLTATYTGANTSETVDTNDTNAANATTATSKYKANREEAATTSLSLGLSYQMGNVAVDWLVNVNLFVNGPYFISGSSNTFATQIAATLNYDSLVGGKK